MMKKSTKSSKNAQLDYINLDLLPFTLIKGRNTMSIVDNSIRRNISDWKGEKTLEQVLLFDLKELCLLSRIHIYDAKVMRLDIEIAQDENGVFIKIEQDYDIVSGLLRIVKVGSLPCRFVKMKVTKGSKINELKKIEFFGLHINDIKSKYDDDMLDILFYNAYDLIYSKNKEE
jgi:hypothetical protein